MKLSGRHDASHIVIAKMFREKIDLKLIKLVRTNPVLYDYNNSKYMDFNSREVAWQRIGDELKRPAVDCKIRWINIRDVHRRICKKKATQPDNKSKPYKYEKEMSFMKAFYKDVGPINAQDDDDDKNYEQWNDNTVDSDSSDKSEEPIKIPVVRRRRTRKVQERTYEEEDKPPATSFIEPTSEFDPADPVDAFLLSIGASLKTFSPYHLNLAKSKIFAVVQEHDLEQIMQKQPSDIKVAATETLYLNE